jgi:hypothetical protein
MPFPFDRNDLRAVSLREILDTSSPLRRVYKAAFAEVRRTGRALVQQADQLESAERNLAAMRHTHEAARADLEARLRSALAAEELLRKSARPSGRSALFWTAAEVALAAAGIPLPTTPITFLLDVIRRRRLTGNGAT